MDQIQQRRMLWVDPRCLRLGKVVITKAADQFEERGIVLDALPQAKLLSRAGSDYERVVVSWFRCCGC